MQFRPKLRTVLLFVNVLILVLPLGSIAALRIYETELVRRTESELLAQGIVIDLVYRNLLQRNMGDLIDNYGQPVVVSTVPQVPDPDNRFNPLLPRLDVALESLRPPISEAKRPLSTPAAASVVTGEEISPMLKEAQRATLAAIRIVDPDGTVVASTGVEVGLSLRDREEVIRALRGESVSLLYRRTDAQEGKVFGPLGRRSRYRVHVALSVIHKGRVVGAVVLMRTPLDVRKALYYHRWPLTIGAALLLGVVLIASILTSLTISRPISRLIQRIESMGRSGKGVKIPVDSIGTKEVDRLSRAFADMANKLDQRAEYINAFVSNVSHAFKTPLASTKAAVELLQDHMDEMSLEEREKFLAIIEGDTVRLERLVKRLIDLARADVVKTSGEICSVPELLKDLEKRYRDSGLNIKVYHGVEAEDVAIDRETLDSVLCNLLDNARQHGGPKVKVLVSSDTDLQGDTVIRVRDNGKGISEANAERIFRPFFTTAQDRGGSGLGLSIVMSLLKTHGGTIELEPVETGTTFLVTIPTARG